MKTDLEITFHLVVMNVYIIFFISALNLNFRAQNPRAVENASVEEIIREHNCRIRV